MGTTTGSRLRGLLRRPVLLVGLAIFVAAIVPRMTYYFHLKSTPSFLDLARGLDQRRFHDRAVEITKQGLIGDKPFEQAPLYPYFMAMIYKAFGPHVHVMRLVQLILGAAACVLVFWIGKEIFGRGAGILAGLIACFYPVSIFYEGLLLREAFAAQMNLVLLASLIIACRRRRIAWWFVSGFSFGLCILVRPNIAVLAPFLFFWIWIGFKEEARRERIRKATGIIVGLMAVLSALVGRNILAGVSPFSISKQGAYVFYIGNAADASGIGYTLPASYENAPKDRLVAAALASALRDPIAYLGLTGRKLYAFINGVEYPNNANFYFFKEYSWTLRNPVLTFTILSPLGIIGLILSLRRSKEGMLLGFMLIGGSLSVVIFYVISRLRYPIVPFFILLSAYAMWWAWESVQKKKLKRLAAAAALGLVLALLSMPRPFTYKYVDLAQEFNSVGVAYAEEGKIKEAIAHYSRAIEIEPGCVDAHNNLGNALGREGDIDGSIRHYRQALKIEPKCAEAHNNLGLALAAKGEIERAILHHDKALRLKSGYAKAHVCKADCLVRQGDIGEAILNYLNAIEIEPDFVEAHYNLANTLAGQGDLDRAVVHYSQAIQAMPELVEAHNKLATVFMRQGLPMQALKHYSVALMIKPDDPEMRHKVRLLSQRLARHQ